MGKTLLIIIICICIGIALYIAYTPTVHFFASQSTAVSYISVKELRGTDTVYIDNKSIGTTPIINHMLTAGSHSVIVKKNASSGSYYQFSRQLIFDEKTNTIINVELGPSLTYSFYNILQLQKSSSTGLIITPDTVQTQNETATIGDAHIPISTIVQKNPGTYVLSFNQDGYIGINGEITLTNNYILEDTIHLFRSPV